MIEDGVTWFLLADGRRARVLVELRRGAALQESADWIMKIGPAELHEPRDRAPRSFDRIGPARHAMDKGANPHEQEEASFLDRVAARVGEAEKHNAFAHLVIAAPPRALGLLREALSSPVRARVRAEAALDILDETPEALRARLTELLRG